jgi:hypothetical protein
MVLGFCIIEEQFDLRAALKKGDIAFDEALLEPLRRWI